MLPEVLEEVGPTMRKLAGPTLCIHARVEDEDAGFLVWDDGKTGHETLQTKETRDYLMRKWKTIFDCAEVRAANHAPYAIRTLG